MIDPATPFPLRLPITAALTTSHAALAQVHGLACKYPSTMAPFAALLRAGPSADLHALLSPGETVFLETSPPPHPGLAEGPPVPCVQMSFPRHAALPDLHPPSYPPSPSPLTCADTPAMLELIAAAFPGYFRPETCRMGRYFGVWDTPEPHDPARSLSNLAGSSRKPARLLGMVGERLIAAPFCEISALAVHPAAAGRGLGTALLCHMLALHRAEGSLSWLFATIDNTRAIGLYEHLGFEHTRRTDLCRITRVASHALMKRPAHGARLNSR